MNKKQKKKLLLFVIIAFSGIACYFPVKFCCNWLNDVRYSMWLYEDVASLGQKLIYEVEEYYTANGRYPDSLDEISDDLDKYYNTSFEETIEYITLSSTEGKCQLIIKTPNSDSERVFDFEKGKMKPKR